MSDNANTSLHNAWAMLRAIWLPGVILSSLGILLRILVATKREGIEVDGIVYLSNAQAIRQDWSAINITHPPLYSMVLASFSNLWTDPEWGARVISAVLGGLWVWPTLWLARETTDERVDWTAGLLVALMPAAVEASTRVLSEALFGFCLTTFLVFLVRTIRTASLKLAGLAGVLGGLATLARPEGMGYLLLACVLLFLTPLIARTQWSARPVLTQVITMTVLWLVIIFPNMMMIRQQTGYWHWSGKMGMTLRWAESVGSERPTAFIEETVMEMPEEDLPKSLLDYVRSQPLQILKRVAINLHLMDKYTLPGLLQSGGLALVILGLVQLRFRRLPAPPEWFLPSAALPLAGLLLFVVESRYFVPVIPVLSIIAAIGLARIGRRETACGFCPFSIPAVVLLIVVVMSFLPWIFRPWFRQDPTTVEKAAGLWLRRSEGTGVVFIGRYPVIGYYAQGRGIPIGRRSLDELLAEGRKVHARFLIADNVRLVESRSDLLGLAAGDRMRDDLEVVHIEEDRAGHRVVIYRLRDG